MMMIMMMMMMMFNTQLQASEALSQWQLGSLPKPPARARPSLPMTLNHPEISSYHGSHRANEITTILFHEVVAPWMISLVLPQHHSTRSQNNTLSDDEGTVSTTSALSSDVTASTTTVEKFDFWKIQVGGYTNAQRIAIAVEAMGPTFVKFGQALSTRPDLLPSTVIDALTKLQDNMEPFDTELARTVIETELQSTNKLDQNQVHAVMESLSLEPVAAASIGQVYKGFLPGKGFVALKVQRPGVYEIVQRDALLFYQVAEWVEKLPALPFLARDGRKQLIATKVVDSVHEFMTRVLEELDYRNEANNMDRFAQLYSYRRGTCDTKMIVPEVYLDLCTDKVIVMEWVDGTKIDHSVTMDEKELAENVAAIELGIAAILSQLLGTGVMHADPHPGNLIKVKSDNGWQLGLLDYGIVGTVPETVRDALVCAIVQVVFTKNYEAVAGLFAELQLLPDYVVQDRSERDALAKTLEGIFKEVLQYPNQEGTESRSSTVTPVPVLRFDKLLGGLSLLVSRFQFSLPPYFVNIARALATLEGMAKRLDPTYNSLESVYPYALRRILQNPSMSPVVESTVTGILRNRFTGRFDPRLIRKLIDDTAILSNQSRRRLLWDVCQSKFGRKVSQQILAEWLRYPPRRRRIVRRRRLLFEL